MAECAVLFAFAAASVDDDDLISRLEYGQDAWTKEAHAQAASEGVADVDSYVAAARDAKQAE